MHKAFIAKIDKVQDIPNADRIHIAYVLGESVVVSKDWGVGKVGVFFQEGLQLSEEFCSENNLFRHSNKNKDNTKKGFFDDNRRVRAQPFLKQKSEGFFTTVESLSYTGVDLDSFKVSDSFDKLEGKEI